MDKNAIKFMRKTSGLEQVPIAREIKKSASTLSCYENGSIIPRADTLIRIAELCEFDIIIRDRNNGEEYIITKELGVK